MLPVIRMTWILNRRLLFQASPLFAFYLTFLVGVQRTGDPTKFITMFMAIAGLATAIVTLQGMAIPVEGFLLSLPVSRTQVVRAKYFTSLCGLAAGLALPLVVAWTAHRVAPTHVPGLSRDVLGLVALLGLFLAAGIFYFLPFVYHFGTSKGMMLFAVTLILFPAGALAWKGASGCLEVILAFGNRALDQPTFALGLGASGLIFGLVSLRLSVRSYQRRGI